MQTEHNDEQKRSGPSDGGRTLDDSDESSSEHPTETHWLGKECPYCGAIIEREDLEPDGEGGWEHVEREQEASA